MEYIPLRVLKSEFDNKFITIAEKDKTMKLLEIKDMLAGNMIKDKIFIV